MVYSAISWKQTLKSIQNQLFEDFECFIIDDASNDNSLEIVNNFLKNDKRFRIIKLPSNMGVSYARNQGIKKSSGRFISFLDADDLWHETFLSSSLNFLSF